MTAPDRGTPDQDRPGGRLPDRESPHPSAADQDLPGGRIPDREPPHPSAPDQDLPDREPPAGGSGEPTSGLRDPAAAVRGVGAGTLAIEALVLLLAIVPLHVLDVRMTGLAIGVVVGLAVVCLLLAGALRRPWAWRAAIGIQVLLIGCGFFHPALAALGVLFTAVWLYVLSVRRSVLGRRR